MIANSQTNNIQDGFLNDKDKEVNGRIELAPVDTDHHEVTENLAVHSELYTEESKSEKEETYEVHVEESSDAFLKNWALTHNITHIALTELLKWFQSEPVLLGLPISAKTLLKTPSLIEIEKQGDALVGFTSTKLEVLLSEVKHLTRLVQFRENVIEENEIVSSFPISSKEKLNELDEVLKNDQTFSEVCTSLSMVGGKDCNETVRKMLTKILTHEMALSCNWSGRNNKNGFKNLKQLNKLILGVARKNPYCRNATQQDVKTNIKQWLRCAPDRQGGRERRRMRQLANN